LQTGSGREHYWDAQQRIIYYNIVFFSS
jgi:hypothetical protein